MALSETTSFLIVDDYDNIRKLVTKQLVDMGLTGKKFEAIEVDSAIKTLEDNDYNIDFIISDWNMPGKSGLEFLNWARKQKQLKNTPFLILTTENEKEKVIAAITAGVSNFLFKPWKIDELAEKIQACANKHNL